MQNTIQTTVAATVSALAGEWSEKTYANRGACAKAVRAALGDDTVRGEHFELRKNEDGRWQWQELTVLPVGQERPDVLTAEEWLREGVERLYEDVFLPYEQDTHGAHLDLPEFRISRGFPRGSRKAIGQCWSALSAKDGATEMFVSPVLGNEDVLNLLQVVAHEMVHMFVGVEHGHKAPFKKMATGIGLTGKMTATVAGEKFIESVRPILEDMPRYPAATMSTRDLDKKKHKTYLLKVQCTDPECGVVYRVNQKVVDKAIAMGKDGLTCTCCGGEVEVG